MVTPAHHISLSSSYVVSRWPYISPFSLHYFTPLTRILRLISSPTIKGTAGARSFQAVGPVCTVRRFVPFVVETHRISSLSSFFSHESRRLSLFLSSENVFRYKGQTSNFEVSGSVNNDFHRGLLLTVVSLI